MKEDAKTIHIKVRFSPQDNERIIALCEKKRIKKAT